MAEAAGCGPCFGERFPDGRGGRRERWDGAITYRLVSTNIRRAKKEGELTYLSSEFSCELEGNDAPPETAVITVWDETLEAEYQREVPLLEAKEQEIVWQEDFTFPITVSSFGTRNNSI